VLLDQAKYPTIGSFNELDETTSKILANAIRSGALWWDMDGYIQINGARGLVNLTDGEIIWDGEEA
jgi:hypothetical protein